MWNEGDSEAQQISDAGNAELFSFAPDGEVIVYLSGGQTELWAINRDGSDLRLLVSAAQLRALAGQATTMEATYTDNLNWQLYWIEGTRRVGFEILRAYEGLGGCCESRGHWQVDVETGDVQPWTLPELPRTLEGLVSPDGRLLAITDEDGLSLANAGGAIIHEDVLTYQSFPADLEFASPYAPTLAWSHDSQSLTAIILMEAISSERAALGVNFAIWRVPANGEPAQELGVFSALPHTLSISPSQEYMTYLRRTEPMSNHFELHLAKIDGSKDVVYAQGHMMEFVGWAPDGVHFIFDQYSIQAPQLGSVCGGSEPLLNPPVVLASRIAWVDAAHFLFVSEGELRLGEVGGGSTLIGPFNEENAYYQFDRDEEALGGMK